MESAEFALGRYSDTERLPLSLFHALEKWLTCNLTPPNAVLHVVAVGVSEDRLRASLGALVADVKSSQLPIVDYFDGWRSRNFPSTLASQLQGRIGPARRSCCLIILYGFEKFSLGSSASEYNSTMALVLEMIKNEKAKVLFVTDGMPHQDEPFLLAVRQLDCNSENIILETWSSDIPVSCLKPSLAKMKEVGTASASTPSTPAGLPASRNPRLAESCPAAHRQRPVDATLAGPDPKAAWLRPEVKHWFDKLAAMAGDIKPTDPKRRIKVAVLDTGIDIHHVGVHSKKYKRADGGPVKERVSFLKNKGDVTDNIGHGTHVAWLVMKVAPEADIYTIKISDSLKFTDDGRIEEARTTLSFFLSFFLGFFFSHPPPV